MGFQQYLTNLKGGRQLLLWLGPFQPNNFSWNVPQWTFTGSWNCQCQKYFRNLGGPIKNVQQRAKQSNKCVRKLISKQWKRLHKDLIAKPFFNRPPALSNVSNLVECETALAHTWTQTHNCTIHTWTQTQTQTPLWATWATSWNARLL